MIAHHMVPMRWIDRWRALGTSPIYRFVMFALGCVLMVVAPLVGFLPGPGGVFVFAIGLGMALRSSLWAKRRYAAFKRKRPIVGGWADWGMRRKSALRRGARDKMLRRNEGADAKPTPLRLFLDTIRLPWRTD